MLAFRIRQKFPDTRITETHPKALYVRLKSTKRALLKDSEFPLIGKMNISGMPRFCAREGFERRWLVRPGLATQSL